MKIALKSSILFSSLLFQMVTPQKTLKGLGNCTLG